MIAGLVLAAGAGTRLRPLTALRPKPLCPVGGRPLVDWSIETVQPLVDRVAVNVYHGRTQMIEHLSERVHLLVEPTLLGTAGAVGALRGWLDGDPLLIANGDRWCPDPLERLMMGWTGDTLRMLVVHDPARADFDGGFRYAGACLVPGEVAAGLSAGAAGLYAHVFEPMGRAGLRELIPTREPFFDCGTPRDYHAANMFVSGGENVVGEGAEVLGSIERTVVWDGARVAPGERLVNAIRADEGVTIEVPTLEER